MEKFANGDSSPDPTILEIGHIIKTLGGEMPVPDNPYSLRGRIGLPAIEDIDFSTLQEPSISNKLGPKDYLPESLQSPSLFVDIRSHPQFAELSEPTRKAAERTEMVLNLCSQMGYVDLAASKQIVDFGAGFGSPLIALAQLANMNGGTVDVLESNPAGVEAIHETGLIEPDRIHGVDGIAYLADEDAAGKHDLITAFMLGPDSRGTLAAELIRAARNALSSNGRLVVTSEVASISALQRVCAQQGIRYSFIEGVPLPDNVLPSTVVIAAQDLRRFLEIRLERPQPDTTA